MGMGVKVKFKYIYGPVASWRLGRSLGVDLISTDEKICSFDCTYCQIGPTQIHTLERKIFVPTEDVLGEIKELPDIEFDYITMSGMGEPTLAKNIGEVVRGIKKLRKESIAVITNSSLIDEPEVREDLLAADRVVAKLDAATQTTFEKVSHPVKGLLLTSIIRGICAFTEMYKGQLDLQIMFIQENVHEAKDLAEIARLIKPDEVEINTPLRPCPVEPLSPEKLAEAQEYFEGFKIRNVYDNIIPGVTSIEDDKTRRRRSPQ
jgi:wyosine [tRNA(Phe)-imidazoG37] synthetase (radical SAM superfamily)